MKRKKVHDRIRTRKEESKLEITGQIRDCIYQNEVNSYTIAVLETDTEEITVVGYLPFIGVGDTVKLIGKFVTHPEYGEQFKIDTFEKVMPQTLEALEKYLASGNIKGIGPATAKKIVETFGEETISVFQFEPNKLANIKGISLEKAQEMAEEFMQNWELWQIVGFLEKFGIGVANAKTIYQKLGTVAIQEIESNPYLLVDLAGHIDFKKIDQMALELGMAYDNDKRVTSGIKYALMKISYNGHCCSLKANLIQYVKELLGVEEDRIDHCLITLSVKEEIIIEKRQDEQWVYLSSFYRAESTIAQVLMTLQAAPNQKEIPFLEKELKHIEKKTGITLSDKQKEALLKMNQQNIVIITGGPGTGKTTIIQTILELYQPRGKKVVLCAPTGRAAKRMSETTAEEAKTLHRLLEIGKLEEANPVKKEDYEVAPIDADVIVVDEMSMVDVFLMEYLVKGIFQGTKLVLVGDVDQLPSVGPGSILKDLIDSRTICTIHLDKIFRQAAKSKIILNAHRVNQGETFLTKEEQTENTKEDFFYLNLSSGEEMVRQVISLCKERLKTYGDFEFFRNIQVLSPTKKGMLGTRELNHVLQQQLNPAEEGKKEKKTGEIIFRIKDRVMQTKNNYDMAWEKQTNHNYEKGSGVFNGELGKIEAIDETNRQLKIRFDDEKEVWYGFSELDQIEHAYAITIHKAQGSEFDVVIVVAPPSSPMLLTRNLLYTAITRAKQLLVILGSHKIIDFMIQNVDSKKRNTGLEYKLKQLEE